MVPHDICEDSEGRHQCLSFGRFTFSPDVRELRRDGVVVHLQRQPAMVLAYLLDRPGHVVLRDELIRHVWKEGHHVGFDQSLNYCIREIRRALDETATAPEYIQTIPREGYKWVAVVSRMSENRDARPVLDSPGAAHRLRNKWTISGVTTVSTALALTLLVRLSAPVDRAPSSLVQALNDLHVVSHTIVDPLRDTRAAKALVTLWAVTASHLGWDSETAHLTH